MTNIHPVTDLQYAALTDKVEVKLDEADRAADASDVRYTGPETFKKARERVCELET